MNETQGWVDDLEQLRNTMVPLKRRPTLLEAESKLPRFVNVVASGAYLPSGYTLPLKTIARSVPCAQYTPRMFAATILKFTDSISSCSALVFSTGCIVVVSLRSENHARYMSHILRIIIESVHCTANGKATFAGRLRLERCEIHNSVGTAELGYRIDLRAMAETAPACCKYFPELFPGLECKIWLTETYQCVCGRAGRGTALGRSLPGAGTQRKCSCVVKLLIFDSGRLVITGARRLQDVNAVYFRIKAQVGEFHTDNTVDRRFYSRLSTMLAASNNTNNTKAARKEIKPDVAVACVLAGVNPMVAPPPTSAPLEEGIPPFMQMALHGKVETVRYLFLINPDAANERDAQGRNTLERLLAIPVADRTADHKKLIEMLSEVKP